jgi:uncharacterized protein YuzE
MDLHLHYDPEVDIAMISFESGRTRSQEHSWGLIDRHPDDGHLMGFEIWGASKRLPSEMVAALPLAEMPDDDIAPTEDTTELHLHYDPEVDIALISFEKGRANSKRYPWGLIDRHPDDGHLMGFEVWRASKVLPAEMVAALPLAGKHDGVAA